MKICRFGASTVDGTTRVTFRRGAFEVTRKKRSTGLRYVRRFSLRVALFPSVVMVQHSADPSLSRRSHISAPNRSSHGAVTHEASSRMHLEL